ncbi:unnamed protein product [Durusdinium trenchii]|uniref:Uncharacterized protein n=2 Tax=Durusdinium trenchii TaxID=1381693 RepID=A0ABP0NXE1_9DINO
MLRLAAVLLWLNVGQAGAELCLDDGVPGSQRKYIQDDLGNDIPIGVIECGWASSTFLNGLIVMMIQEILGFHAVIDPRVGASGASPIYALAGCADFDNAKEKNCGSETKIHVSVDSWSGTHAAAQQTFAKQNPTVAAEDLGSMGYAGEESMYVSQEILHAAYSDAGLALDFYKSYNTTHHDPKKYFDSIHDVDISELALCSETVMSHPNRMGNYARFSGDLDGVERQADGTFIAKCANHRWWYAPACRSNASTCIPVFTGGDGWKLQAMMQWSTAYGIPAAIAISAGWSLFVKHVQLHRALHYWWVPDATFIDMLPEQLIFARHSPNEWLEGDKKTGGQGSYVSKMVSKNLQWKAGRVREFVSSINFELPEVQSLLLEVQQSGSSYNVSCKWMRENRARWSAWKPVETNCYEGFGLFDAAGSLEDRYVESREGLSDLLCRACPPGSSSEKLEDSQGTTFICRRCPAGRSQVSGASLSCDLCPLGEYQDETGSISCKRCGFGEYQNATGQSSCTRCPAGTTTLGFRAQSINDCGCKEETINVLPAASGNFECQRCGEGLRCPFGSSVEMLRQGSADLGDDYLPQVVKGYVSRLEEPLQIFKCRPASFCSGGKPGECAGGLSSMPCASCEEGKTWSGTKCEDCGANVVAWALAMPVAVAGLIGAYSFVNSEVMARASAFQASLMAAGIAVNVFQSLAIFGMMTVQWTPNFESTSSRLSVFVMDIELLGLTCVTGPENFLRFLSAASAFPAASLVLVTCWAFTTGWNTIFKRSKLQVTPWRFYKTANTMGVILQVGFGALAALALQPLMCYRHPNGQYSLLKYPDTICGSDEHKAMLGVGIALLIVYVVGFFVYCCFGAWKLPSWSSQERKDLVRAFLFLISKFRLDVWWFGLLLLIRGLGFSLAIVLAMDSPQLQVAVASIIMSVYLFFLTFARPWKAPLINVADIALCNILILLVNQAVHPSSAVDLQFVDHFSAVMVVLLITILVMTVMLCILALVLGRLFGRGDFLLNLAREGGEREKIAAALKECAQELLAVEEKDLAQDLGLMNIYDLKALKAAIPAVFVDVLEISSSALAPRVALSSTRNTIRAIAASEQVAAAVQQVPPVHRASEVEVTAPDAATPPADAETEELDTEVQFIVADPEQPESIVATNL